MTDQLATQALASQIYELSGRITSKHYWVNIGFACAAASLLALLGAMVSYVIRVNYVCFYFAIRSIPQSTSPGKS